MKCPGQDTRYWDGKAIFEAKCPNCGEDIEFFKDDTKRKCPSCGNDAPNPRMDFGCAAYCPYAEQCLGHIPEGLRERKGELIRERLAQHVKRVAKTDFKLIKLISHTVSQIEQTAKEEGLNLSVAVSAAHLLHIPLDYYKNGGFTGPSDLLEAAGFNNEQAKRIEAIIARCSDKKDPMVHLIKMLQKK